MTPTTVSWRKSAAVLCATLVTLLALVVVYRSDGLAAVDASASRAIRWFVHQPTGRVVLVDGYAGRALASIDSGTIGDDISVAEARPAAYLLNENTGEARQLDTAALRLGPPLGVATLGSGSAVVGVTGGGLVVVDPAEGEASLVANTGAPIGFSVPPSEDTVVALDGAVWSYTDSALVRTTSTSSSVFAAVDGARFTVVGSAPFVVDPDGRRARFDDGRWIDLPTDAPPSELVVQEQGPAAECGWVAANDDFWCVSEGGIDHSVTVDGIDVDGSDQFGIAGDTAVLLRRGPDEIVRFDWVNAELLPAVGASIPAGATLTLTPMIDIVWVDDTSGDFVWAVTPWAVHAIDKNGDDILVLGETGEVIDEGESDSGGDSSDGDVVEPELREPDDNGIDDPPVAVDDPVTARTGSAVPVAVTANDYDPDGEAVVVVGVDRPGHGTAEVVSGSTVVYNAEAGYVGLDSFDYTIADGNGTEATATVTIDLLPVEAPNRPPVGTADTSTTGPDRAVVVEVLLNDVDPERDALQIGSFTPPTGIGEVTETIGPSGLPALRFDPVEGFEGTAQFSYQPVDSFGGVGSETDVSVEVAPRGDANREPLVRPDSARVRRGVLHQLPVLANDVDPDGDDLILSVVRPLPPGLDVEVRGESLDIVANPGADNLLPFQYEVDDGAGHTVRGAVLVNVIDDDEPNRAPLASPDFGTAVVGQSVILDVTLNDIDPDGDPLVVTEVTQPDDRGQAIVVDGDQVQFTPAELVDVEESIARFTYTISDGNGHFAVGDLVVNVVPEPVAAAPYAQDDSTSTFVNEPVTIDVLRNDGDPSGERPRLVGTPGCPNGGTAVVTSDNQVRFDPPAGQSGAFRCSYEVTNSQGLSASAAIIVSVRERPIQNQAPIATTDQIVVAVGETVSIDVTINDIDPDGPSDELTVVSSTAPSLGTATRDGDTITFTAGSIVGDTRINYQVADRDGAVALGRVVIRITERVNRPPIANPDARTIFGPGVPTSFDVLINDVDPEDSSTLSVVSAELVSGPGDVSLVGRIVTISPPPDYIGDIVASYTIRDDGGLFARGQVRLTILEPVNRPPSAADDFVDVASGATVTMSPLFNDSDPDGDQLNLLLTGGVDPSLGTISLNGDRSITFTGAPGASGVATVGYTVSDGELTASAFVRINVRPCSESAPIALSPVLKTGYQQPIRVDLAEYAANGDVVDVEAPPGLIGGIYTPPAGENGNVAVSFAVVNGCRQRATGRVTIDVNQDPLPQPQAASLGRTETREISVTALASDDEPLVISGSSGAPSWVLTQSDRLVITPPLGVATGTYSWTTTVRDPGGLTAAVPVAVSIVNRAPVAVADTVDVSDGKAATVTLLDNDDDPDGPASQLRIQSVPSAITFSNGATGTVTLSANDRSVEIDPRDGEGTATFSYSIVDGEGAVSSAATVTVIGPRQNTPPFADDQSVSVTVDVPTDVVLDAGDPDGTPVELVDLSDPDGVIAGRAGLTLTLVAGSEGTYTVTYRVSDGDDLSRVATLTVQATDPPPTTPPPTTAPPTTAAPTTTTEP